MGWTNPVVYEHTNVLTPLTIDQRLTDNLIHLANRPSAVKNVDAPSYSSTSTSFVQIDEDLLHLPITTTHDCNLWLSYLITTRTSGSGVNYQECFIDVWWENKDIYLSEYLAGAVTNSGLSRMGVRFNHAIALTHSINLVIPNIEPDDHLFVLHWKTDVETITAVPDSPIQFSVREL